MLLFSLVYLSAAEVLSNSRGEGFETIAFWGMGFSERRLHLGLRESRAGTKVDLERIENCEEVNLMEEEERVAAAEEPPTAAMTAVDLNGKERK